MLEKIARQKPQKWADQWIKKEPVKLTGSLLCDPSGTRTQNTLIKSQLLCQIELMGRALQRTKLYLISMGCQEAVALRRWMCTPSGGEINFFKSIIGRHTMTGPVCFIGSQIR